MGFELTIGLVPRQILDAAEVLWTSRTLEALARGRGRRGGLGFCRILCWAFGRALGAALPRSSTAAARWSLHLGMGMGVGGPGWRAALCGEWPRTAGVVWTRSDKSPAKGHPGMVIGVFEGAVELRCSAKVDGLRETQTARHDATGSLSSVAGKLSSHVPCGSQ